MGNRHLPAADVINLARGNRHLPAADVINLAMGNRHLPAADVINLAMGNRHLPAADVINLARGGERAMLWRAAAEPVLSPVGEIGRKLRVLSAEREIAQPPAYCACAIAGDNF